MAAANIPLTYKSFFEALLQDITPSSDITDYHEAVKEKLQTLYPLTDEQVEHSKVLKFVESFTTTVRKHWQKNEMRLNRIFKKHSSFYSKVINFGDLEPEVLTEEEEDDEVPNLPEDMEAV